MSTASMSVATTASTSAAVAYACRRAGVLLVHLTPNHHITSATLSSTQQCHPIRAANVRCEGLLHEGAHSRKHAVRLTSATNLRQRRARELPSRGEDAFQEAVSGVEQHGQHASRPDPERPRPPGRSAWQTQNVHRLSSSQIRFALDKEQCAS